MFNPSFFPVRSQTFVGKPCPFPAMDRWAAESGRDEGLAAQADARGWEGDFEDVVSPNPLVNQC